MSLYLNDFKKLLNIKVENDFNPVIGSISYDSRQVRDGCLFICKGRAFKKSFLESAIKKGALAYISEVDYGMNIECLKVDDIRACLADIAALFYANPQKDLSIIGVTGTKGKTSTVSYIHHILSLYNKKKGLEAPALLSSSINFDGRESAEARLTTPEPIELFSFMRRAVDNGVKTLVMEVSSQALKYGRCKGLRFDMAGFLNISPDHISSIEHRDFEDYFSSKLKIFQQSDRAFVNMSSDKIGRILAEAKKCSKVIKLQVLEDKNSPTDADYMACNLKDDRQGFSMDLFVRKKDELVELRKNLYVNSFGFYNGENALMAIAMTSSMGVDLSCIEEALGKIDLKGRSKYFSTKDGGIKIMVDYAHNGLSFLSVLKEAKRRFPDRRIVALFGATGDKGRNRRFDLGRIAGTMADFSFICEDDPGSEDPMEISKIIGSAIEEQGGQYCIIIDRQKAFEAAMKDAADRWEKGEKSLVMLLGKGDAEFQIENGRRVPEISDFDKAAQWIEEFGK